MNDETHDKQVKDSTKWADQDLYTKLSDPSNGKEEADAKLLNFLRGVEQLRRELGIPDVLVIGACHYIDPNYDEDGPQSTIRALALGQPNIHAELGAIGYQQYTMPMINRAAELARLVTGQAKK